MVQDSFIPNIIHMDKFCHKIRKTISMVQYICKPIHQGPGTGWFPSDIKIIGIGPYGNNWKYYKHVQLGQRLHLQSESFEKKAILYGTAEIHKHFIMGEICVYNWTAIMVDMGPDNIVYLDRDPIHAWTINAWIKDLLVRHSENTRSVE